MRAKWRQIGIELDVTSGTLDAIKEMTSDPAEQLKQLLIGWINTGKATWRELVTALYSVPVGETQLARKLEQNHLSEKLVIRYYQYTTVNLLAHV